MWPAATFHSRERRHDARIVSRTRAGPMGSPVRKHSLAAASLDITERRAYGIVTDLAKAGYVLKQKDGRRNRYQIQAHLPLPEPTRHERTVGEVLALLAGTDASAVTDANRPDLTPPPARQ